LANNETVVMILNPIIVITNLNQPNPIDPNYRFEKASVA